MNNMKLKRFFLTAMFLLVCLWGINGYAKNIPVTEELFQEELKQCLEKGSGKIWIVSKDGSGDFQILQEAVDNANDGDTIVITPGVYDEAIKVSGKSLSFLGTDTKSCIIKTLADRYDNAVFNIGKGSLYNLTIYAYVKPEARRRAEKIEISTVLESAENLEVKKVLHEKALGYAIHADQEDMIDSELHIMNCKIVSDANQCLGMGVRSGNKVEIAYCEIVSTGQGGCIYYHNTNYPKSVKKSQLMISNSEMVNLISPYFMTLHSLTTNHPVELTFINNNIKTVAFEKRDGYKSGNVFTGETIDSLIWNKTVPYIKIYDEKESHILLNHVYQNDDSLKLKIELTDGINYLKSEYDEDVISDLSKKKTVYEIYNFDEQVGDGWLGLESFELTKESIGNTLIEMNYESSQE